MDDTRARELCASTCKHRTCTGLGDRSRWAHRCQLHPVAELAPVFTTRDIPPPTQPSPELVPHVYGPHDPATAPTTVTVLGAGKWPQPETRALPAAVVELRAQVNQLAHEATR